MAVLSVIVPVRDGERFVAEHRGSVAEDRDDALVFLARNAWGLRRAREDWPDLAFLDIRERGAPGPAGGAA